MIVNDQQKRLLECEGWQWLPDMKFYNVGDMKIAQIISILMPQDCRATCLYLGSLHLELDLDLSYLHYNLPLIDDTSTRACIVELIKRKQGNDTVHVSVRLERETKRLRYMVHMLDECGNTMLLAADYDQNEAIVSALEKSKMEEI